MPILWAEDIAKEKQEKRESGARIEFKKITEWDLENIKLWKKFTAISLSEIEKKLELLNVHADYNIGESFYEWLSLPRPNDEDYPDLEFTMKDIVAELIEKWVAIQNEDGSVGVVFSEETKIPSCVLQKKDGTGLYLTSDLAAIRYRLTNGWNPSKIIYCVDVRQQLHLKQAFTIAKMAWWVELGADNVEFTHAYNGFIKLKEWAMSTRHGTVIFLEALIEEGNERTEKILEEKWRTGDKKLSQENIQAITIWAIKYSYLMQDREKDVVFDWDKALNFEWHSGPYIQYAYVRARKISSNTDQDFSTSTIVSARNDRNLEFEISSHDKSIIQILAWFEWVVDTVAKTYKPHHLALYAYDLAVGFNSFYVHTPKILEESNENLKEFRLALVTKTARTLKKALDLLAIKMPSEM
jgi:arginyl-tRNA synthetase